MEMIIQYIRWIETKLDNSRNSVGNTYIQITDSELWKTAATKRDGPNKYNTESLLNHIYIIIRMDYQSAALDMNSLER